MDHGLCHERLISLARFFIDQSQISGDSVAITGADAHHLRDVLRLKPGDVITVLDGANREYCVRLDTVDSGHAEGSILSNCLRQTEPRALLTLAQCLPKGDKMELVLQKGTEIGYTAFIPVVSERSIVKLDADRAAKKGERWRKIVQSAAEQSGRARLPEVHSLHSWQQLCDRFTDFDLVLLPWEGEEAAGLKETLKAKNIGAGVGAGASNGTSILVIIGPEGGLAVSEVEKARSCGALTVSLGPRILRTETAGLACGVAVLYESGDFS
ncbi:MAG TPA: 16S rRNA (uracil(1498)-N(3))-methyltransferase [Firmicutes bacterium]|jgi:16S rRNA (uracil1498-N3)-methyltransferase|nr:16S rRNA (uracil(1498)-N(3))-methyltransferase [Bacillota bacterium]HCX70457.1 16S rRNA (uracil(1498)-N(3))-methyltransferase [Bacillota bacterium]